MADVQMGEGRTDRDRGHRERGGEDRYRSRYDDRDRGDRDRDRYGSRRDDRRDRERGDRHREYDDRPRRHHEEDRHRDRRGGRDDGPPRSSRHERDDGPPGRGRRRDRDGTPERRSPTPEGALPLSQRKRKATGWDVHAPGYEQYTAQQAKQTGLFPLPGANRTQVAPILAHPGLPMPMPVQAFGMGMGNNPNLARQSRRLYIGSITPDVNEQNLAEFFNDKMRELGIGTAVGGKELPVVQVQLNYEKNYAFVEFRTAEDATAAMAFDGIIFINGPLKIRRPKDYGGIDLSGPPGVHVPGVVSTNVPDSINKIYVGGLPSYLNEEQVQELLTTFGELKAFNLVRDNGNGPSKGFAFFEYVDPDVTDAACQGLNGTELGDRRLVVQRASVGAKPGMDMPNMPFDQIPEIPRPIMPAGESETDARILLMLNMVTTDDLVDDQEYEEIYEDIKEECASHGPIEDLRIPRPVKKDKARWGEGGQQAAMDAMRADEAAGVGRVYVKFNDAESAARAMKSLAGRSFAGRSIIATVLSEDSQTTPPLNLIFAPQPEAAPPLPA
ncbi:hypothetical protein SCHPADRAFT_141264 [Schizopora paradoxa]|uniref:Splicing factor U2AF subunit n=1 Tax=Schizopora paradoxa TaxID=27342 RepID=A0A0H2S0W8_9AGAM|nr:hypothetical protein SCHPADRAFT_141264 [Schizopora paradoxa]